MIRSILIIEPDLQQGKQVARLLMQAGYDAVVVPDANEGLPRFYQTQPNAVILSNRLSADEMDRLSDSITTMSDLPVIELIGDAPLATIARRFARSVRLQELLRTLDELLEPGSPTDGVK
jgi:DNA-binding response OmpR family regulator